MHGQRYVRFPAEVNAVLTGNRGETKETVVPLFRELSLEEEQEFRQHARENYIVGSQIREIFHPVWQDEAHKMNVEAGFE